MLYLIIIVGFGFDLLHNLVKSMRHRPTSFGIFAVWMSFTVDKLSFDFGLE